MRTRILTALSLTACLALALDALWRRQDHWRWLAISTIVVALGLFAYFFPILSAAKLCCGKKSFEAWMWLPSWR